MYPLCGADAAVLFDSVMLRSPHLQDMTASAVVEPIKELGLVEGPGSVHTCHNSLLPPTKTQTKQARTPRQNRPPFIHPQSTATKLLLT